MLDNFIRGGQVFLHNVAMFKQVIGKTFSAALLFAVITSSYLYFPAVRKLDYLAAVTYVKAFVARDVSAAASGIFARSKNPKINAYYRGGLYAKNIAASKVMSLSLFQIAYKELIALGIKILTITGLFVCCFFLLIYLIWSRFGKFSKESKLVKGGRVLNLAEVKDFLKHRSKASDLKIGDMPLVKDQETRHILVTGMTGAGKSNLINILATQIRRRNNPALVIDRTGEMISRYYEPERGDIIFNPFDARCTAWNFWDEIAKRERLDSFATSLFCTAKSGGYHEDMWDNLAKKLFISSVEVISKDADKSFASLYELIALLPLSEASKRLKDTAIASLLDPKGDKTALSIRATTVAFIEWLRYLPEILPKINSGRSFSLREFVAGACGAGKGGAQQGAWLFVSAPGEERTIMRPLQSLFLDLTILTLQSLGANRERRFWLIADELSSMKKMDALPQGLSELRKYGGCILAGLQSLNQIFDIYGRYSGSTMIGQFATKFIFRTEELSNIEMITETSGKAEYLEHNKNISYGAHEYREGISYAEHKREKPLISAGDLASLKTLECYVRLPEPEISVAKITTDYLPAPKNLAPFFVPKEENC